MSDALEAGAQMEAIEKGDGKGGDGDGTPSSSLSSEPSPEAQREIDDLIMRGAEVEMTDKQKQINRKMQKLKGKRLLRGVWGAKANMKFVKSIEDPTQREKALYELRKERYALLYNEGGNRCVNCLLTFQFCVCSKVHEVLSAERFGALKEFPHRVNILMHAGGKLLLLTLGEEKAGMVVREEDESEKPLLDRLQYLKKEGKGRAVVLFPAIDAVSVEAFLKMAEEAGGIAIREEGGNLSAETSGEEDKGEQNEEREKLGDVPRNSQPEGGKGEAAKENPDSSHAKIAERSEAASNTGTQNASSSSRMRPKGFQEESRGTSKPVAATISEEGVGWESEGLEIILIDGTWRQAKRLNKYIPQWVPRVALPADVISNFVLRGQAAAGRVSTAEAFALFLKALEERSADRREAEACRVAATAITESLLVMQGGHLAQSGKIQYLAEKREKNRVKVAKHTPAHLTHPQSVRPRLNPRWFSDDEGEEGGQPREDKEEKAEVFLNTAEGQEE